MIAACPLCGNVDVESGVCGDCMRELGNRPVCAICLERVLDTEPIVEWHDELAHQDCALDADMLAMEAQDAALFEYRYDRG